MDIYIDGWTDGQSFQKVLPLWFPLSLSGYEVRGSLGKAQKLRLPEYHMAWNHAAHLEMAGKQTPDVDILSQQASRVKTLTPLSKAPRNAHCSLQATPRGQGLWLCGAFDCFLTATIP